MFEPEEIYQEKFNRRFLNLNEKEVIEKIINWKNVNGVYNLRHLTSLISPDLDFEEYCRIEGLYLGINILRQELGFNVNKKPGDFDIIVIPYSSKKIHFERTGVIEVKIVRPSRKKPLRNANSLGVTQVEGLILDGFPFIGLMHVSLSEPLKDEEKIKINYCKIAANSNQKIEKGKTLQDYSIPIKFDTFQWFSADKQMQRLLSTDLPKYVSILCFGLSLTADNTFCLESSSTKYNDFQKGYFNPHLKQETIEKVKHHFFKNKEMYLKRNIR